jgi:hypothetical protein
MFNPSEGLFKQFLKSPHHLALGVATLGIGFLSASIPVFILGLAAYALGWIYLPESGIFKAWVQSKINAINTVSTQEQITAFQAKRQQLIGRLNRDNRNKYEELVQVCRDIEQSTKDVANPTSDHSDMRLRKIDELMWTYLRLLVMHESLESFLDTEQEEGLPKAYQDSQQEVADLDKQNTDAITKGIPQNPSRTRLLESKRDRLNTLKARLDKIQEAKDNVLLVAAEQDRLVEQIKLLRADAIATRNADTLSARIDVTVQNLTSTNEMITQMNQFKELVGDELPNTPDRLGFATDESDDTDRPTTRRRQAVRN